MTSFAHYKADSVVSAAGAAKDRWESDVKVVTDLQEQIVDARQAHEEAVAQPKGPTKARDVSLAKQKLVGLREKLQKAQEAEVLTRQEHLLSCHPLRNQVQEVNC